MEGPSFSAGPLLDFFPAFFAGFGSNGILKLDAEPKVKKKNLVF
jgi:hypothetical protein